jgi:hypothetical protein
VGGFGNIQIKFSSCEMESLLRRRLLFSPVLTSPARLWQLLLVRGLAGAVGIGEAFYLVLIVTALFSGRRSFWWPWCAE